MESAPEGAEPGRGMGESSVEHESDQHRLSSAQVTRAIDLQNYTLQILKNTIGNATRSYKFVTYMCIVMFAVGLLIFAAGAIDGLFIAHKKVYPLAFSGLGATTFVAVFLAGSIERTQNALSNLVQVEVAFMNYFEQLGIWESFATLPTGDPPRVDPSKFKTSSDEIEKRAEAAMALLEKYTEVAQKRRRAR
jgi:hypothetical protein